MSILNESFVLILTIFPKWVKSNAEWWHEGQILDSEFLKTVHYLLNEQIVEIPDLQELENPDSDSVDIPNWIKSTAGWWASETLAKVTLSTA